MAVIADGSAKFRVRTVFQMPAGAVLPFAGNTIPKGRLLNTGNAWNSNGVGAAAFGLDASKSNSIYGASTTVQPPAIVMKYIIKA